jgi:hypothetical protein
MTLYSTLYDITSMMSQNHVIIDVIYAIIYTNYDIIGALQYAYIV